MAGVYATIERKRYGKHTSIGASAGTALVLNAIQMSRPSAGIIEPLREFEVITVQCRGFMTGEVGERLVVIDDSA
jgi:hypothetical protein